MKTNKMLELFTAQLKDRATNALLLSFEKIVLSNLDTTGAKRLRQGNIINDVS